MLLLSIQSEGFGASYDLTDKISKALQEASHENAPDQMACVFARGSTVGLAIMRYEQGTRDDLLSMLDGVAPVGALYQHEVTTGDKNASAHLRSVLMGTSVHAPIIDGRLDLAEKHRIVLFDFDDRPAQRTVYIDARGIEDKPS